MIRDCKLNFIKTLLTNSYCFPITMMNQKMITVQQESLTGEKFGESSAIRQIKTIQISTYN